MDIDDTCPFDNFVMWRSTLQVEKYTTGTSQSEL